MRGSEYDNPQLLTEILGFNPNNGALSLERQDKNLQSRLLPPPKVSDFFETELTKRLLKTKSEFSLVPNALLSIIKKGEYITRSFHYWNPDRPLTGQDFPSISALTFKQQGEKYKVTEIFQKDLVDHNEVGVVFEDYTTTRISIENPNYGSVLMYYKDEKPYQYAVTNGNGELSNFADFPIVDTISLNNNNFRYPRFVAHDIIVATLFEDSLDLFTDPKQENAQSDTWRNKDLLKDVLKFEL